MDRDTSRAVLSLRERICNPMRMILRMRSKTQDISINNSIFLNLWLFKNMENNSEFGQLFLNLFLPVRDEDEGGGVVSSALSPLHQVFQFVRRELR